MNWSFWFGELGLAFIGPSFILFSSLRKSWKWVTAAAAMVVVGIVFVRFNIVVPALIPSLLPGLAHGDYAPNWIEWASSAGVIALGLSIFSLAAEVLPLDLEGGAHHG